MLPALPFNSACNAHLLACTIPHPRLASLPSIPSFHSCPASLPCILALYPCISALYPCIPSSLTCIPESQSPRTPLSLHPYTPDLYSCIPVALHPCVSLNPCPASLPSIPASSHPGITESLSCILASPHPFPVSLHPRIPVSTNPRPAALHPRIPPLYPRIPSSPHPFIPPLYLRIPPSLHPFTLPPSLSPARPALPHLCIPRSERGSSPRPRGRSRRCGGEGAVPGVRIYRSGRGAST